MGALARTSRYRTYVVFTPDCMRGSAFRAARRRGQTSKRGSRPFQMESFDVAVTVRSHSAICPAIREKVERLGSVAGRFVQLRGEESCAREAAEERRQAARGSNASGGRRSFRTRSRRCRWSQATRATPRRAGHHRFRGQEIDLGRKTLEPNDRLAVSHENHGAIAASSARKKLAGQVGQTSACGLGPC